MMVKAALWLIRASLSCSEQYYVGQSIDYVWSEHHYDGQSILWWPDYHCDGQSIIMMVKSYYDGQSIIMRVRASLWWSEHHDGQSIIMMVRISLWRSLHHYDGQSSLSLIIVSVMYCFFFNYCWWFLRFSTRIFLQEFWKGFILSKNGQIS